MNPSPEIAASQPEAPNAPILEGLDFGGEAQAANNRHYRKIGQLPKPLRDLINTMLDDSRTYAEIIRALNQSTNPPLPYSISEMNLSNWKARGYRQYLAHQERMDLFQLNRESASEIVAGNDTALLPEATLQMVASQYFDVLGSFSLDSLKAKFAEDPLKYTRFLSVFVRTSREILALKKHREAAARTAAVELEKLDLDRELNDRENELLVKKFDQTFKIRRPKHDSPAPASATFEGLEGIARGLKPSMPPGPAPSNNDSHHEAIPEPSPVRSFHPASTPPASQSNFENQNPVPPSPSVQSEGLIDSSRGSESAQTPGSACAIAPHPEGMPEPRPTGAPVPVTDSPNNTSAHESPNIPEPAQPVSLPPELCPKCQHLLPPLLPDGQRPFPACWFCSAQLHPPGTEFCPSCHDPLPPLQPNGERPYSDCRLCGAILPIKSAVSP